MKIGARNQFTGEVVDIKNGTVMSEVAVEIAPGMVMSSVMTMDSCNDLNIKKGDKVKVIAKAVNVLLIKPDAENGQCCGH